MALKNQQSVWRKHGPLLFVGGGLFVIFASVVQIQNANYLATRADGVVANIANSWGVRFEPTSLYVDESGNGVVRIKLGSLGEVITHARMILEYDESEVKVLSVSEGGMFENVDAEVGLNRSVFSSSGEGVFGEGTWVRVEVELLPGIESATLQINEDLSQVTYDTGESLQLRGDLSVSR